MRLIPLLLPVLLLPGCIGEGDRKPSGNQAAGAPGYRRPWSDDDVELPAWRKDPSDKGHFIGAWGAATRLPGEGQAELRDRAALNARSELARMMKVRIQTVFKSYTSESSGGLTQLAEDVSRSVADESLEGTAVREDWSHPKTGEMFVWVVLEPRLAERMAEKVAEGARAKLAADNSPAAAHLRAKLAADQGFAELDRMLDAQLKK